MPTSGFTLSSPDFADGARLPDPVAFEAPGANISPTLVWHGAPAGTLSYALTCFDPDAPTGSGWWHWLVINLPASVQQLAAGAGESDATLPAEVSAAVVGFNLNAHALAKATLTGLYER